MFSFFLLSCVELGYPVQDLYSCNIPVLNYDYWYNSFPLRLSIGDRFNREEVRDIEDAIEIWNEQTRLNLFEIDDEGTSKNLIQKEYFYMQDYLYDDEFSLGPKKWGVTLLKHGVIANNIDHFRIVIFEENYSDVDFLSLVIHELGHALTLNHVSDKRSIMYPMLKSGDRKRDIDDEIIDGFKCFTEKKGI